MSENLERWKTYVQVWEGEANRFWVRSNIFLIVTGIMFSAIASFSESKEVSIIICIVGFILSLLWKKTNIIGKHYVDRWKVIIEEVEKKMEGGERFFSRIQEIKDSTPNLQSLNSSTHYMRLVIDVVSVGWLLLGAIYIFQMISSSAPVASSDLPVFLCHPLDDGSGGFSCSWK